MRRSARPSSAAARAPAEPWRRRAACARCSTAATSTAPPRRRRASGSRSLLFALGLCGHRRPAGHVRGRARQPRRARAAPADAVATARPDILDRNGEILATDVQARRRCSPSRAASSTSTRRSNCSPPCCPTSTRPRCASGCPRKQRLRLAQARDHAASSSSEIHRLGLPGIGFLPRTSASIRTAPMVSHLIGHVNIDNQGIAGIEKWLDTQRPRRPASGRASPPTGCRSRSSSRSICACSTRCATNWSTARDKFKAKAAAGLVIDVRTGEIVAMVSVPDYDPNNPREAQRSDPHQPPHHRRVRDGLDLQGAHARDGARFRQDRPRTRSFDARVAAALRPVQHPRLSRPEPRADACRRSSPIRPTSAPRAWRSRSASSTTRRSCASSASSTGCAPNCRKAPSRWCPSAGASSTP